MCLDNMFQTSHTRLYVQKYVLIYFVYLYMSSISPFKNNDIIIIIIGLVSVIFVIIACSLDEKVVVGEGGVFPEVFVVFRMV